jgi:hypothetical protein
MYLTNMRDDDMMQLFLKYCDSGLTEEEQHRMNQWIQSGEGREEIFREIKQTIEFQKQMENAGLPEIKAILKILNHTFQDSLFDLPDNIHMFMLDELAKRNLSFFQWKLCCKIVYGRRWIRVIKVLVRLIYIILMVWIILALLLANTS